MSRFLTKTLAVAAFVVLGLTACYGDSGQAYKTAAPETSSGERQIQKKKEPEAFESDAMAESGEAGNTESSGPSESAPEQQVMNEPGRLLTEGELRGFEEYLNQSDNYGFLLSDYRTPEFIDLNEVFYSGAGLEQTPLTEEEMSLYLQTAGQPELYTDLVRLSTEQINGFLSEKTGLTLDRIKTGLGWIYLPQYDRYYAEHGDTNMRSFFCPKGEVEGENYRIWCISDGYSQFNLESIVTLKKESSGYRFLSNEIIWDYSGAFKAGVDTPAPEALHYVVSAYKLEVVEGGTGIYPPGKRPQDYDSPVFESDTRYYSEEEMQQMSWRPELVSVFRNEIYARHGYIFKNDVWNDFFSAYTWYSGVHPADSFDTGAFNEYEKANLKLAVEIEQ